MINEKLISEFANVIGYLKIASNLESLKETKNEYEMVLNELLNWINYYYKNKNLNIITPDSSLKVHAILSDIRNDMIFRKDIGLESELTDTILIHYEVIIKTINELSITD